jgi:hypothetical protein
MSVLSIRRRRERNYHVNIKRIGKIIKSWPNNGHVAPETACGGRVMKGKSVILE